MGKKKKTFYVTTPIYYPNDVPHIGHAYTTIAADILSRWNKLQGKTVYFQTGTDEHGKKLQETAEKVGKKPKDFIDVLIPEFKKDWVKINAQYDHFIRTTDKEHEKIVQEMLQKSFDNGDIYLGDYEGLYCVGCEAYYTEKDLLEGNICPVHKKKVEKLKEKSYFFKLSKYKDKLLKFYKDNPDFILPKERANHVIASIEKGLPDLSISRTSFDWGIPLPFDKKHVCYVWFDALFNYYSGALITKRKDFWPADVHLIGKDILWFHVVYWPAFLMSVGLDLPKSVFSHGWWTVDGEKMSKSLGNVVNIDKLVSHGADSARYFLFRNTVFGQDGDFSEKALIERHNNELANKLGNLVSRVSALAEKYALTKVENKLLKKLNLKKIEKHFEDYEIDKALNEIFAFIDVCNEYVQSKKPWEAQDERFALKNNLTDKEKSEMQIASKKVLYELADSIKALTILLSPILPETSEKISKVFNFEIKYENMEKPLKVSKIQKADILFTKIEVEQKDHNSKEQKLNKSPETKKVEGIATMADMIKYDDFAKLDLRVGQIKSAEDIEGADKLYKLTVDLGKEIGQRTILAGIKKYYKKEDLKNKLIIVISNLEPRKMKGLESQGMLLAAGSAQEDTCVLISPDKNISPGTKIN